MTSLTCLLRSGLNCTFHWKAHSLIFSKLNVSFFVGSLYQILLKKEKYHQQKFCVLMLFHQADHLCKLKKEALIQILVELQIFFPSTQKSDHLNQPFAYDFPDNLPAEKVIHHQHHKLVI